jgi:hypothetical protein
LVTVVQAVVVAVRLTAQHQEAQVQQTKVSLAVQVFQLAQVKRLVAVAVAQALLVQTPQQVTVAQVARAFQQVFREVLLLTVVAAVADF